MCEVVHVLGEHRTDRMDALMSVVQMPDGVPVACMAINGARNAAIYAAKILAQGGAAPPHGRWTASE